MKRYRIFAEAQSYSILPNNGKLKTEITSNDSNMSIVISNISTINLIGKEFSKRLSVIAEIEGKDILSAVGKCKYFAEQILDRIALEVGMPIEELEIYRAFDITGENEDTEFVGFDYDVLDKIGSKAMNLRRFDEIIKNTNLSNDRLARSLHWYRKGLNEIDLLDIFSYFWISLETLNPLFENKYPEAYEIRKCKKCNAETKSKNTAPLKMFFQEILKNVELYSKARKIRVSIVHGIEDTVTIQSKALEIIDELELACRKAIFYLLDIDGLQDDYNNGIANNEKLTFVTFMKLSNFVTDESNPKYFVPEVRVDIAMSESNGELGIKPIIKTNIFDHGCALAGLGWDMYGGDPGYPIKKMQIQING